MVKSSCIAPASRRRNVRYNEQALHLVDAHLAGQSASQGDVAAVQHHRGMRDLNGHGTTYRAPIATPQTPCINRFVRAKRGFDVLIPMNPIPLNGPTMPPAST